MGTNPWKKESEKYHKRGFSDIKEMKFKDGAEYEVRVLPGKNGSDPFYGYVIHWIPQRGSAYGKPITHPIGERCLVCEYIGTLYEEIRRLKEEEGYTDEHEEIKRIYKMIGDVRGQHKYDFNIIDRNDCIDSKTGKKFVKRMGAVKKIWEKVFDIANNEKWGDPSDPETGYDFIINTDGSGQYRQYSTNPDRESTPLTDDEIELCKTDLYDLANLRKTTEEADLIEVISGAKAPYNKAILAMGEDEEDDEPVVIKKDLKPKKEEKEKPVASKKDKPKKEEVEEPDDEEETASTESQEVDEPETEEEASIEESEKEESKDETPVEESEEDVSAEESKEDDEEEEDFDENDINNYECKGQCDPDDEGCDQCPVQTLCTDFKPVYEKAIELKIDVSQKRKVVEITKDVEAKSSPKPEKDATPAKGKRGKRGRKIPF